MNQLIFRTFEPICCPPECPPTPAAASLAELLKCLPTPPHSGLLVAHHLIFSTFEPIDFDPGAPAIAHSHFLLREFGRAAPHSGQQLIDLPPHSGPLVAHH